MHNDTTFKPNTRYYATYNGHGEFYSGIRAGERVLIDSRGATFSVSIQSTQNPGAWLTIYSTDYAILTEIVEAA